MMSIGEGEGTWHEPIYPYLSFTNDWVKLLGPLKVRDLVSITCPKATSKTLAHDNMISHRHRPQLRFG